MSSLPSWIGWRRGRWTTAATAGNVSSTWRWRCWFTGSSSCFILTHINHSFLYPFMAACGRSFFVARGRAGCGSGCRVFDFGSVLVVEEVELVVDVLLVVGGEGVVLVQELAVLGREGRSGCGSGGRLEKGCLLFLFTRSGHHLHHLVFLCFPD